MTSVFQLYGRPLDAGIPLPPLRITGDLEDYTVGESYEGRLQMLDSIGKCVVEIVESSLPPGSYAFVDNFTKEIVLRWPAYAPPDAKASGVSNGDFEQGNAGSWRLGSGWSIEAGGAETGTYSAVYQNQRGSQSIESNRVPYTPGQSITAACRFQQGASSAGNLAGRILLIWCDANGNMIPGGDGISWTAGTLILSGSNGEWRTSDVTGASNHPSVATVAVGFSADRKKQNRPCRVDNFTWDHEYSVGTNSDLDFTVTFKVTDSANRVAYWSGDILQRRAPAWPAVLTSIGQYSSAFSPSFSCPLPTVSAGDRLIAIIAQKNNSLSETVITPPAGFTLFHSYVGTTSYPYMHVWMYYKDCTGDEPPEVRFTGKEAGGWGSIVYKLEAGSFASTSPQAASARGYSNVVPCPALAGPKALRLVTTVVNATIVGEREYPLADYRISPGPRATIGGNIVFMWACGDLVEAGAAGSVSYTNPVGDEAIRTTISSTILIPSI